MERNHAYKRSQDMDFIMGVCSNVRKDVNNACKLILTKKYFAQNASKIIIGIIINAFLAAQL